MLFTTFGFVLFLAALLPAYAAAPRRFRWAVLLAGSTAFYAFAGPVFLLYILSATALAYCSALAVSRLFAERDALLAKEGGAAGKKALKLLFRKRAKKAAGAGIFAVLAILATVKYADFALSGAGALLGLGADAGGFMRFALPMGISFYTFQTVGYLIDVYREKARAERNPLRLALFVSFFPQVVQGPISRFGELSKTLYDGARPSLASISRGGQRVLWGFFKKLVIADRLWPALAHLAGHPDEFRGAYYLLAIGLYAVILFCDFTGGIDIAIGAAEMFGVRLPENFNRPFYSKSIQEYWQRWHMTMYSWFRDYVFYPVSASGKMLRLGRLARRALGDGAGKRVPVHLSLLWVWFLTGLWHGAAWHFIAWGLANGLAIMVSMELRPLYARFHGRFGRLCATGAYRGFQIFRTFWLMNFIRSFDIYEGVLATLGLMGSVFTGFGLSAFLENGLAPLGLPAADYFAAGTGLLVVFFASYLSRDGADFRDRLADPFPWQLRHLFFGLVFFMTLVLGAYGFGYDARQFIYNQF